MAQEHPSAVAGWVAESPLQAVANEPLAKLLGGVNPSTFRKRPRTVGLRELQRDMARTLNKSRENNEYVVLTNRGAPSFLLIPLDRQAWTSLLAVAPPEALYEQELAEKEESEGHSLPSTDEVLSRVAHRSAP
jgi:antitoxin (DNA-binding transcriptional repressor) of toxin-antitoxin stability system